MKSGLELLLNAAGITAPYVWSSRKFPRLGCDYMGLRNQFSKTTAVRPLGGLGLLLLDPAPAPGVN
jgi:hypothetical protein